MRGSLLCLDPDTNAYYQMLCCYTEVLWVVGFGGKLSWNVVFLWLNDMTFRRPKVRFTCATTWIRGDFAIHSFSRCKILLLIQPLFWLNCSPLLQLPSCCCSFLQCCSQLVVLVMSGGGWAVPRWMGCQRSLATLLRGLFHLVALSS